MNGKTDEPASMVCVFCVLDRRISNSWAGSSGVETYKRKQESKKKEKKNSTKKAIKKKKRKKTRTRQRKWSRKQENKKKLSCFLL